MSVQGASFRSVKKGCSDLYDHRQLLFGLVKNELKGKYNNSALGLLWHVINPVMQIFVYALVFSMLFGRSVENYWAYLSVGVFAYNYFSTSMNAGTNAIVSHRNMVTKMYFPREILVISNILVNLTTFIVSYIALIVILLVMGVIPNVWYIMLVPVFIILESIFVTGLVLATSSLNVFYRDVSYSMHILTMLLMFMTPIFYMLNMTEGVLRTVLMLNPLTHFVEAFHNILYFGTCPEPFEILLCMLLAAVSIVIGQVIFKKLEYIFPEKL